jgi:hypothetical protein
MRRPACLLALGLIWLAPPAARAGRPSETLPQNTFLVEVGYIHSFLTHAWGDQGQEVQLIDRLDRYEPGGGLQGVVIPDASVVFQVLVMKLQFGLLDDLSLGLGIPVVLQTTVEPRLKWVPGDYMWWLGRTYTEADFWDWAASMGQPRPGTWQGNQGVLSDLILGARWRFSDRIPGLRELGLNLALAVTGALPTGRKKDPEEVVASGTTTWDLHFQGELCFHLSLDGVVPGLDQRLALGLDLFYEILFERSYQTPTGAKNPLILTQAPYAGENYRLDPGDFLGFQLSAELILVRGPVLSGWLTDQVAEPERLPPLLGLNLAYAFTYLLQSDWESESALWDWTQEKLWRPGYKNRLAAELTLSFLRLGAPLQLVLSYSNLSWLPGKNSRATDTLGVGLRAPVKFF